MAVNPEVLPQRLNNLKMYFCCDVTAAVMNLLSNYQLVKGVPEKKTVISTQLRFGPKLFNPKKVRKF